MSYQPKVYRRQGGDEIVVADGGLIRVESGGQINVVAPNGTIYFVDTNVSASGDGLSWGAAFNTMAEAFAVIASGDTIRFRGNVTEHLTTPTGVQDVAIIGVGNRPRHADTHPLNGELAASTWKSGGTDSPLLTIRCVGWLIANVLFAPHANNYALKLERTGDEDATEQDASHLSVINCKFAAGAGGISDTGGCAHVVIRDCVFYGQTAYCILGVGNIGVGQLAWKIEDCHFNNFTNGVKVAGHECVVQRCFFTDGGTPTTTVVLNLNNGGGRDNFVIGNAFQTATANFNDPDIVGCATDCWYNFSLDGGAETGVPA